MLILCADVSKNVIHTILYVVWRHEKPRPELQLVYELFFCQNREYF